MFDTRNWRSPMAPSIKLCDLGYLYDPIGNACTEFNRGKRSFLVLDLTTP
jgi:hypothetical protein